MRNLNIQQFLTSLLLVISISPAWAEDKDPTYDRVTLSVSAETKVGNDTLVAVLYSQKEGANTTKLAREVNQNLGWALDMTKQTADIKVQTLDYRTDPIYRKQVLQGWRVKQSLRLESRNSAALSDLIGKLQKRLAVESISYQVSPEKRKSSQDELIQQALADFRARAEMVAKAWERPGYRLVQININTSDHTPRPKMMRMAAMEMSADAMPAPAIEAGSQTVRVSVSGVVELTP
ncbi:MAG: SIMPL domain-containing protein [gamma proteobacterium endosymbiont of Lamellibrachia anaximandri]|nr:SIMPL domain-containing protein [gamma proteobacterium endosymbiont of Lamellibrachia anaximandri]MBL3618190.1 SIMPL domain-containing protein [gamma proteobacterium endosymbiont of Lamellibrachia anaximandri]